MISISIICSFYNMDKYFETFLTSVENQNEFEKKIEIIISLNKPSKYAKKIITKFKKKFPNNVKTVTNNKVISLGESWNQCIKESRGRYIAIWNVDDLRVKDSLVNQEKILKRNKNIKYVYGNYSIVNKFNSINPISIVNEKLRKKAELKESMILGPFFMFKKQICKKIGFFDEQLKCASDFDFAIRMANHYEGKHLNKYLGYYLNEKKGLSTSKNDLQQIESNVVYFRYGLFHKLIKKHLKKIINYKIYNYFFFKKKYQIKDYFKLYDKLYITNKKKNIKKFKKKNFFVSLLKKIS